MAGLPNSRARRSSNVVDENSAEVGGGPTAAMVSDYALWRNGAASEAMFGERQSGDQA
jgi:hypothetical protein